MPQPQGFRSATRALPSSAVNTTACLGHRRYGTSRNYVRCLRPNRREIIRRSGSSCMLRGRLAKINRQNFQWGKRGSAKIINAEFNKQKKGFQQLLKTLDFLVPRTGIEPAHPCEY